MLELSNVNTFIGRRKIINNVSFTVKDGSVVGLIGPNGAGKTTIMKTILGLTKFTGVITLNGKEITENNHSPLTKVGALIEHPAIYPFLTGLENLKLYSSNKIDMMNIVEQLKMNAYIDLKAKGYSLGMKQKLGIAIALLNKPRLVILDEPMNGLDIEATILVRKIIKQYSSSGTSFLISSHILGELEKVMTAVVLISDGRVITNCSIEEFEKINNQQYQLYTENMPKTLQSLNDYNINFSQSSNHIVVSRGALSSIQKILYQNNILLLELKLQQPSFEDLVVTSLKNHRGSQDEK
ncbi:ABC transporter ATP-binding protein [Companilactobacillus keshanensis]|uniref:ABC transporter ATP-binding protein n=1 Tax=Companilactobacillus keshanensis TaxID=2486003 RepID=A0ABW4BTM3_9LACO|nr:ATP-binding cassette domain-containing protein [Companilactobacillus keshanensis]